MIKVILISALIVAYQCRQRAQDLPMTLVTGLWRTQVDESTGVQSYQHQLQILKMLVLSGDNLIVFGDEQLRKQVKSITNSSKIVFVRLTLKELSKNPSAMVVNHYLDGVRNTNKQFYSKYSNYVQFNSSEYATIMFSKLFLLEKALNYDKFESRYIYWVELDMARHSQYQRYDSLEFYSKLGLSLRRLSNTLQLPFLIGTENYDNYTKDSFNLQRYGQMKLFAGGEYFGGRVHAISTVSHIYHHLLRVALSNGDYWTHQNILTIMIHNYPKIIVPLYNYDIFRQRYVDLDMEDYRERGVKEMRYVNVRMGENGIKIGSICPKPQPIIMIKEVIPETFFEYEMLLMVTELRVMRQKHFLTIIIFIYLAIQLGKFFWRQEGKTVKNQMINN